MYQTDARYSGLLQDSSNSLCVFVGVKLSVFEWKILRKIFGPTREVKGIWRIKTNKELDELRNKTPEHNKLC